MSEKIEIKLDGKPITFQKSDSLVAVKTKPGAVSLKLARLTTPVQTGDQGLGGFELRRIDAQKTRPLEALRALEQDNSIVKASEVFHTSDDEVPFVPTGEIFLRFTGQATNEQMQKLLDDELLAINEARDEKTFIVVPTAPTPQVIELVARLQAQPIVAVAEPDLATFGQIRAEFVLPADELLREQWHLENTGFHRNTSIGFAKGADARVIQAWKHARTLGRPEVVVAVIDDGFDLDHPDLAGAHKIVAPRDFTRNSDTPEPDAKSQDWHGTACAGVAVGSANGRMITGAAPGCRLMPVRWGRDLSDGQIEAWFDWVQKQGAWVVSCSWGAEAKVFPLSTRAHEAIAKCARQGRNGKGTVICFAAGNLNRDVNNLPESHDGFATHPDVIAVAASTSRDQRAHYSNFGKEILVCAPSDGAGGWGITTSDVTGTFTRNGVIYEMGYARGPVTHTFGGTSSACPLVAGICALVLSVNPDLTAAQVRNILKCSARKIGNPADYSGGHSRQFGFGCVDALKAVKMALAAAPGASTSPGSPSAAAIVPPASTEAA